jgi:hypothetical protein
VVRFALTHYSCLYAYAGEILAVMGGQRSSGIEIQLPGPGQTGGERCRVSGIRKDDDLAEAGSPSSLSAKVVT